ncbi:MAG TPA: Crp/Fnr family transcriptional regulator [Candidatus Angelobacter sp.]|jgi:CRP/FNR family transcriptional regulator, cyclic AMP receptor protein|nr:Crp/Fnr family transcriptional regulator [Candidatus Angelobacter sp.]
MANKAAFRIIENCLTCEFREDRLFCDLPDDVLEALQSLKTSSVYPKGTLLCLEGQAPRGIYVLCTGRAKLSTTSAEGKSIILRIAEPGEVLGLTAVVSNQPYESTVETLETSQANFIPQRDFLRFVRENAEVGMKVAQQLTHNCHCAYQEIRSLGHSNSVPEKLAKLILAWSEHPLALNNTRPGEIPIRVTLTQEEIAQFVGTSRETVSRTLGHFKRKGLLRMKGATWWINKTALANMVTT